MNSIYDLTHTFIKIRVHMHTVQILVLHYHVCMHTVMLNKNEIITSNICILIDIRQCTYLLKSLCSNIHQGSNEGSLFFPCIPYALQQMD